MTKAYYFSTFGQTTPITEDQKKLLMIERTTKEQEVFVNSSDYVLNLTEEVDFEQQETGNMNIDYAHSGKRVFKLDQQHPFSISIKRSFMELTNKDHAWVKISMWIYPDENWKESKLSLIATFPVSYTHLTLPTILRV